MTDLETKLNDSHYDINGKVRKESMLEIVKSNLLKSEERKLKKIAYLFKEAIEWIILMMKLIFTIIKIVIT